MMTGFFGCAGGEEYASGEALLRLYPFGNPTTNCSTFRIRFPFACVFEEEWKRYDYLV